MIAAHGTGTERSVRIKWLRSEDASITYALQVLEARGPQALGANALPTISMSWCALSMMARKWGDDATVESMDRPAAGSVS